MQVDRAVTHQNSHSPRTSILQVVANYGFSNDVVNWRLIFGKPWLRQAIKNEKLKIKKENAPNGALGAHAATGEVADGGF